MNIAISVPGVWHAFQLGEQLTRRGALHSIYTSYPTFWVPTGSIEPAKIKSIIHPELVSQLGNRVPGADGVTEKLTGVQSPTTVCKNKLFDKAVARRVARNKFDVFIGFSGASLASLQSGNDQGTVTVVERLSAHIEYQAELLKEEYLRHGNNQSPVPRPMIEREKREYATADYIAVPSTFVYETMRERGVPDSKLLIEGYPVDTEAFSPSMESQGPTRILFAGNVGLRKGIPYLLAAWDAADVGDAELLIAGHVKPEVEHLRKKFEDDQSVRFLGWVNNISDLYATADVFVLPSIEDGFGKVVIEAMASGLPVIVSENTGAKDCITDGDNGYIVPIRDAESLRMKLEYFCANSEVRSEMGNQARERITSSKYAEDNYGECAFHQYQSISDSSQSLN